MATGLLFLHGVGQHQSDDDWLAGLDGALMDLGFSSLNDLDCLVAPKYSDLLSMDDSPKVTMPERTAIKGDRWQARRDFELSQGSLRRLLGVDPDVDPQRGPFGPVPDDVANLLTDALMTHAAELKQAGRYVRTERIRSAVLSRVLEELPEVDRLVVVGHSLGSLVAIDLLDHLPATTAVVRVVTIGSPAGLTVMHQEAKRLLREFPYGRVRSWLNVLSPLDPVPAGRGLSSLFPATHDLRVDLPLLEHGSRAYLRQPQVALAIGEALFGSLTRSLAPLQGEVRPSLTRPESEAVFALAFAHMTHHELGRRDEDAARRYGAALAVVQAGLHDALVSEARGQGRQVAQEVETLASGQAPSCPRAWTLDESVRLLIMATTTNLVLPWEVEAHESARDALPSASVGLGFGAQQGSKVATAISEARKALGLDKDFEWDRILLGAAGVAMIVAAPIGIALAVPAGLAGAAALTSALAAFGPGGMIGGMALAGTLVGTGAVATASAALVDAPAAVLEVEVLRRVADARARQLLGVAQDPLSWWLLTDMQGRVAEEHNQLSGLSDKGAPTVKQMELKLELLQRAIDWMLRLGLGLRTPELPAGDDQ